MRKKKLPVQKKSRAIQNELKLYPALISGNQFWCLLENIKMKKKNFVPFHCAKWFCTCWANQGALALPQGLFAVSILCASTQKVPWLMPLRQTGLRRVFLAPQARCWLRRNQQFCFTQTDDNSVCSLTCVDSSVLTKPKHHYKSMSPKRLNTEENLIYSARRGNLHIIILECTLIFMTVLDGGNFESHYKVHQPVLA